MSSGASGRSQGRARKAVLNSVDSRSILEDGGSTEGEESRLRVSDEALEGLLQSPAGEVAPPLTMEKLDVSGISRIRSRSGQVKELA